MFSHQSLLYLDSKVAPKNLSFHTAIVMDNNRKKKISNSLFFILIVLLTLNSCNSKKGQKSQPLTAKTNSVKPVNQITEFLDLFKTVNPEGLHIYPPTWDKKENLNKTPYGKILKSDGSIAKSYGYS